MTQLNAILDAQATARQLTIDEYLALDRDGDPPEATATVEIVSDPELHVATETPEIGNDPHSCEFEAECRAEMNVSRNCGFISANTTHGCPKRRRYLSLQQMEVTK